MMVEFCPRCGTPVDTSGDDTRLCDACGWFGDNAETAKRPPDPIEVYPVCALLQTLALYRDVCRNELKAEQYCEAGRASAANDSLQAGLRRIQREARNAARALVELYIGWRNLDAPPPRVLVRDNGCVPWPDDWSDACCNGGKCCDMLVGPCSCGAWHTEAEDRVRAMLLKHNARISDGGQP